MRDPEDERCPPGPGDQGRGLETMLLLTLLIDKPVRNYGSRTFDKIYAE
jgi:hypothetical protein